MNANQSTTLTGSDQTNSNRGAESDSPGVLVFPPALYLGTLLFGIVLHLLWPFHLSHVPWTRLGGVVLFILSASLAIWGRTTMLRAGTNVIPSKPSLVIVTNGPFRFTRNPLYLAATTAYLGLTLLFNTVWPLLLFAPLLLTVYWGIIRREERYLEAKFGDVYLAYKAKVWRWI